MMKIAAIVLAAGESKRMGQNKLLLHLNDKTLIESILDALADANIDETVVVLGHKPQQIIEVIKQRLKAIKIVINKNYKKGMTSSFQKGLLQVPHADCAFLVLGDQPILDSNLLNVMTLEMEKNEDKTLIVSPTYRGKKGHPLLFSKRLFNEILNLRKTETIRDVVHRHSDALLTINASEWTTIDIDTQEDFARVRRLRENR